MSIGPGAAAVRGAQPGSQRREVALLTAMAAATSLAEQRRLAAELEAIRAQRVAARREEAALDLAAAYHEDLIVSRHPVLPAAHARQHTAASDWLAEPDDEHDPHAVAEAMVSTATAWWSRLSQEVREDERELAVQAGEMARRHSSQYGRLATSAAAAFMGHVDLLYLRAAGRRLLADQVPPSSTLPVGVDDDETAYDDGSWAPDTGVSGPVNGGQVTPSLQEGTAPAGDTAQGIDNPINDSTHDAGPATGDAVDYLDGTTTPPKGTQDDKVIARRVAARVDVLRGIVTGRQAAPVEGMLVDPTTASALLAVHQTLDPVGQQNFERVPLAKLVDLAWQHTRAAMARLRAVADGAMPSDRGELTQSLDEGTPPAGDVSQPAVDTSVVDSTHDAGPGNGAAEDFLDGQQYALPTTGAVRPTTPGDRTYPGVMADYGRSDAEQHRRSGEPPHYRFDDPTYAQAYDAVYQRGADPAPPPPPAEWLASRSLRSLADSLPGQPAEPGSLPVPADQGAQAAPLVTCPECGGAGTVPAPIASSDVPADSTAYMPCPLCQGAGQVTQDVADHYSDPAAQGLTAAPPPAPSLAAFRTRVQAGLSRAQGGAR